MFTGDMNNFVAFSNDELNAQPRVHSGQEILCSHCGEKHVLESGTSNGKPSDMLLFYKCEETVYLGAVNGALVTGLLK